MSMRLSKVTPCSDALCRAWHSVESNHPCRILRAEMPVLVFGWAASLSPVPVPVLPVLPALVLPVPVPVPAPPPGGFVARSFDVSVSRLCQQSLQPPEGHAAAAASWLAGLGAAGAACATLAAEDVFGSGSAGNADTEVASTHATVKRNRGQRIAKRRQEEQGLRKPYRTSNENHQQ